MKDQTWMSYQQAEARQNFYNNTKIGPIYESVYAIVFSINGVTDAALWFCSIVAMSRVEERIEKTIREYEINQEMKRCKKIGFFPISTDRMISNGIWDKWKLDTNKLILR